MCNVIRLHAMFKQASNKYDSQQYQDFPPEIIDDFLYDAQLDYLKHCVTSKPIEGILKGFESNQQRMDMIQTFIKNPTLTPIYTKTRGKQNVTVFRLPKDYYTTTEDLYAFDKCSNSIKIKIVRYQNLDSYINTSKKLQDQLLWSQGYATIKDNELHVFFPEVLSSVEFHYVILPKKTFSGNYQTLENQLGDTTFPDSNTSRINSLVPEAYCHTLIDIAVANVFGNLRDYNLAQYKKQDITL